MKETYTYTARSAQDPDQLVTLTLHDHHMSVEVAAPLEHIETALEARAEESDVEAHPVVWLKPLAVSLLERATKPFLIRDVAAKADNGDLQVKAWYRTGGLRLAPVTLVEGRVDNPEAADAFVKEVERRQASRDGRFGFLAFMDYWATWLGVAAVLGALMGIWRRSTAEKDVA